MAPAAERLRESREETRHVFNATMEVLENEEFMAGVLAALQDERDGVEPKDLDDIRREQGFSAS